MNARHLTLTLFCGLGTAILGSTVQGQTIDVVVEITNLAPTGGPAITPPWVGFHSGSFDSYNGGLAAQPGLEAIAEDGNTAVLSAQFNDFDAAMGGYTYVGPGPANALVRTGDLTDSNRVDGTLVDDDMTPPLLPGESVSQSFTIQVDGSNRYFSYAAMVIPTNDLFVANGDPTGHDLMSLYDGEGSISFNIGLSGMVNDAGTEAADYMTSAANGLFGLMGGQGGPDSPAGSLGLPIANVTGDPFADFGIAVPDEFNFNDVALYPNGLATVTITAVPVPEPSAMGLGLLGLFGIVRLARRRRR